MWTSFNCFRIGLYKTGVFGYLADSYFKETRALFLGDRHKLAFNLGTGSFLGVNCGRGVLLTTHPLVVPRSWKSTAIPLPTLWATPGL